MTFLPVLALGSTIAYFSFSTSSCDAVGDQTVMTLLFRMKLHLIILQALKKWSKKSSFSLSIIFEVQRNDEICIHADSEVIY